MPTAGVNVAFLRSGQQFAGPSAPFPPHQSPETDQGAEALVAFLRTGRRLDTRAPALADAGPRRTKQQRLEDFYQKTLAAPRHRPGKAPAGKAPKAQPRAPDRSERTINLAFLRSGRQFSDTASSSSSAGAAQQQQQQQQPGRRLRAFVARTGRAAAAASRRAALDDISGPPTINLAFLRSGRQFVAPPDGANPRPQQQPGQRLRAFVAETARAADAAAATAATHSGGGGSGGGPFFLDWRSRSHFLQNKKPELGTFQREAESSDQSPEACVVFLRSGQQHASEANSSVPATATGAGSGDDELSDDGPECIVAFLRSGQRLCAAPDDTPGPPAHPINVLNLDFLRSGRQFEELPAASSYLLEQLAAGAIQGERLRNFVAQTAQAAAIAATRGRAPAPATPLALNLDFLRSGRQFAESRDSTGPRPSRRQRLRKFVEQTSKASAAAPHRRRASSQAQENTALLRSEFARNTGAKVQQSSWNAERDPRDEYFRNHAPPAFKKTRAQRLEEFYQKTLAAASPKAARKIRAEVAAAVSSAPPAPLGINVQFLQSGKEFSTVSVAGRRGRSRLGGGGAQAQAQVSAGPRRTKQQRLEDFYQKTLAAASPRDAQRMRDRVEAAPTIVNLKFLQSGFEFRPNTRGPAAALGAPWSESLAGRSESGSMYEEEAESVPEATARLTKRGPNRGPPGPRTTKAERLKAFYNATLKAAGPSAQPVA